MEIRRSGNFGIIDTGTDKGLISFSIGGRGKGWEPSSIQLNRRGAFFSRKISVNGTFIVPMGDNNDMPGEVMRLLDKFYAGEGIMGKIAGLQWGEGPRLYEDAIDEENNRFYRRWKLDPEITADLESWDYTTVLHRSLVDLTHMQGFFIKFVRNRAPRVGNPGRLVRLEHIPYQKARLVYPPDGEDEPQEVLVGDFPYPDPAYTYRYPVFDPAHPFKYPVSVKYYNIYSFCKDFMSTPRFLGALDWLELAGGLAAILIAYNENASAISLHIESPQSYWDRAEARIKQVCDRTGEKYTAQMLEDFKDEAMEKFASNITGRQNAGKYMHTTKFWNPEANNFEGWTVEPLDKKIKGKYSINSLVYWVTYVHNVVYSFYRSMIYCYINSTQRCAGSIVIDIIPTNGADKRKFFPFAPYFPVTNVIKRYFYPYFPAIIGIKGYSFPYFPYLSGIMKIKTALYSLFSRLDWHKTVVFPCLGEIYEGIRSLSWEIPVT